MVVLQKELDLCYNNLTCMVLLRFLLVWGGIVNLKVAFYLKGTKGHQLEIAKLF